MESTAFLFSIPDASRLLSVSRNHLYKLNKTARIPSLPFITAGDARRFGGSSFFSKNLYGGITACCDR